MAGQGHPAHHGCLGAARNDAGPFLMSESADEEKNVTYG
jgi:hypothetical protein